MPRSLSYSVFSNVDEESVLSDLQDWPALPFVSDSPLNFQMRDYTCPPIPTSVAPDDVLPDSSGISTIATSEINPYALVTLPRPLAVKLDKPPQSYWDYKYFLSIFSEAALSRFRPALPETVSLAMRIYWKKLYQAQIVGPSGFSYTRAHKEGMSPTMTTWLSSELGVSASLLQNKVSQTLSTFITISPEDDTTIHFGPVNVPDESTWVWALWQLVEQFALVDPSTRHLIPSEYVGPAGIVVSFPAAACPNMTPMFSPHISKFSTSNRQELTERGGWVSSG